VEKQHHVVLVVHVNFIASKDVDNDDVELVKDELCCNQSNMLTTSCCCYRCHPLVVVLVDDDDDCELVGDELCCYQVC
jgi:hypothetical protein